MKLHAAKPRPGLYRRVTRKKIIITDRETKALIAELCRRTGESVDAAIEAAVDARLTRIEREMRWRIEWSRGRRPTVPRPFRVSKVSSPGRREAP